MAGAASPLVDWIKERHGGNKAAFARAVGVVRQQVQKWVSKGYIVTGDGFIIPPDTRRDLTRKKRRKPNDAGEP